MVNGVTGIWDTYFRWALTDKGFEFFDYAHCRFGIKPTYPTMLLALSNRDILMKSGLEVQIGRDSQVTIGRRVPRECLALLEVRVEDGQIDSDENVTTCGRAMFGLIEKVLNEQYSGGEHILKII